MGNPELRQGEENLRRDRHPHDDQKEDPPHLRQESERSNAKFAKFLFLKLVSKFYESRLTCVRHNNICPFAGLE